MSTRKEFRDLASLEEAVEVVEELKTERRTETVSIREADGRVLSEAVDSPIDVPGFDRSVMDGYAVRAEDTYGATEDDPVELEDTGTVRAGTRPEIAVDEGEAAEIPTGAVIPEGADAVVMVEETQETDGGVEVYKAVAPGNSIMSAGADVAAGERVLSKGTRLTPREIGLLAALGFEEVDVYAKPKVGIVSTGDEIVRPGGSLEAGQIFDVNTFSVAAAVEEAGGDPVVYEHVGDDYDRMEEVLRKASEDCDLVLSSGSTSASAVDVVYRVIEEKGEMLLHGIAVKPGKPTIFGRLGDASYIGLPGNPISALSIFRLFASRVVRHAAGLPEVPESRKTEAVMADSVRSDVGRTRLLPVGLVESPERGLLAYSLDKGSGATTSLSEADGYVVVESEVNYLADGDEVEVVLLGDNVEPPALLGVGGADSVVNEAVEDTDARSRWLDVGSVAGARKVRDGVADIAGVNLSPDYIDSLGVEDACLVRGYERHVGLVVEEGNPEEYEGIGDIEDGVRFAGRTDASGTRVFLDEILEEDEKEVELLSFRSHDGVANAVESGKAKVGIGLEDVAEEHGLGFVPLRWESFDFLVAESRASKDGVEGFLNTVESLDLEDEVGYRSVENAGEVVEDW